MIDLIEAFVLSLAKDFLYTPIMAYQKVSLFDQRLKDLNRVEDRFGVNFYVPVLECHDLAQIHEEYRSRIPYRLGLKTVVTKLASQSYRLVGQYFYDLLMIGENCCSFNVNDHAMQLVGADWVQLVYSWVLEFTIPYIITQLQLFRLEYADTHARPGARRPVLQRQQSDRMLLQWVTGVHAKGLRDIVAILRRQHIQAELRETITSVFQYREDNKSCLPEPRQQDLLLLGECLGRANVHTIVNELKSVAREELKRLFLHSDISIDLSAYGLDCFWRLFETLFSSVYPALFTEPYVVYVHTQSSAEWATDTGFFRRLYRENRKAMPHATLCNMPRASGGLVSDDTVVASMDQTKCSPIDTFTYPGATHDNQPPLAKQLVYDEIHQDARAGHSSEAAAYLQTARADSSQIIYDGPAASYGSIASKDIPQPTVQPTPHAQMERTAGSHAKPSTEEKVNVVKKKQKPKAISTILDF